MTYKIKAPETLRATVDLPASKSISNRALIISAIAGGDVTPQNLSHCDDTNVTVDALRDMPYEIDIKAAGSAMRFMTAYLSITPGEHLLTGTERMRHRPVRVLVDALRSLGADIAYAGEEGFPPLTIRGKRLYGGHLQVEGNISSQYISALLMIGPAMEGGLTLQLLGNIISRSYIDLTIGMMRDYGADVEWTGADTIVVKPQPYKPIPYLIENDWTASSYWYEMVALSADPAAEVRIGGLMDGSGQGDTIVKYIFSLLGVRTTFANRTKRKPTTITLRKASMIVSTMKFDFSNCPDLAQTIVCTCCGMGIPFEFTGLSTLKIKETDRIHALKTELMKLGFVIYDRNNDTLVWEGERKQPSMEPVDTYEDHRMAMAIAPLAMKLRGLRINNPEVVSKSYPDFWDHLRQASFSVEEA